MVLFNHATREMTAKIVYYGPGLCGKTTNLMVIFDKLEPQQKGKMLSLATKTDRTLFFDLLPVDVGKVGAFNLKIQLYTVPGQVFYNETRKLVLKGADSVVFVADSQPAMVEANRESFANLMDNLQDNNIDPNDTPIVIQYNKRDLPGVVAVEALQETLGFEGYPYTEAAAIKGEGVMETFRLISKITAKHLYQRLQGGKSEPAEREKPKRPAPAPRPKLDFRPEPEPEPVAEAPAEAALSTAPPMPDINPFADSVPFPDSAHADASYERMEEVSLEQLLSEGRERPTFSGNVPIPVAVEEVEELGAAELVEEPPIAVEMEEEAPQAAADEAEAAEAAVSGDGALELRVRDLEEQIESMRTQHRAEIEEILRSLGELTSAIRSRLL